MSEFPSMDAPRWIPCLLLLRLLTAPVAAAEEALAHPMRDGFALETKVAWPDGIEAPKVKRVIVLVHGSGPQSMDEDLTEVTEGQAPNLVFKDISDLLVAKGFAVVRYHKRAKQCQLAIAKDPAFKDFAGFKAYAADPFEYFIEDAREMVELATRRFPAAAPYLLGHSEGAYTGLQLLHRQPAIRGIALIGFAASGLECLVLEQFVYRPLGLFKDLDANRDEILDGAELGAPGPVAPSLKAQMAVVDLDGDGTLSRLEFQAGNYSNMILQPVIDASMILHQAKSPRLTDILQKTDRVVCFFQGLWDNQTPAYHTKAVELVNRNVWKKPDLHFRYFPEHGHALDPRKREDELVFRPMSPEARAALAEDCDRYFVAAP